MSINFKLDCPHCYSECLAYFIESLSTSTNELLEDSIEKAFRERDRKKAQQDRIDSGSLGVCSCGPS